MKTIEFKDLKINQEFYYDSKWFRKLNSTHGASLIGYFVWEFQINTLVQIKN